MMMKIKTNELPFQFNIVGGYEKGFGIFISKVEPGSKVDNLITIFTSHKYLISFHSDGEIKNLTEFITGRGDWAEKGGSNP